jgi:hypothetical protein
VLVSDGAASGSPPLDLIAYVADDVSGWGKGIYFPEHVSEAHLIGHPATADFAIAVAAYAQHGYWGSPHGERAWYSGRGTRVDGEQILSVSAPDDPVTATWIEGRPGSYRIFGGTSGASPHVAGAAALMIQAQPTWGGEEVRAAIRAGALADDAVGPIPNGDWGWGKLRVHRSLYGTDPPSGPPTIAVPIRHISVGERASIPVLANDPDDPEPLLGFELDRDYDGVYEEPIGTSFEVVYQRPGRYVHKVRVIDASGREAAALARIVVSGREALDPAGGCAMSSRHEPLSPFLFLGLLGLNRRRAAGTRRSSCRAPRRAKSAPRTQSARAHG